MKKKITGLVLCAFILMPIPLLAANSDTPSISSSNVSVRSVQWAAYEGSKTPPVSIIKDTSQVFRFDRPITRVAVSNPDICDITTVGERDVLVYAKKAGNINLLAWDENDSIAAYNIQSMLDLDKLHTVLQNIDSTANLSIIPFNDTAAVYGTVETSIKLKQVEDASKAYDKNVLSFVKLKESKQVLLEVRFAEVNRKANKDLKIDLEAIPGFFSFRSLTGQTGVTSSDSTSTFTSRVNGVTYDAFNLGSQSLGNLTGTYISAAAQISYILKWLEQKNVLKFIARPNLVAKDGEEAKFIVGGEFPIPVSTNQSISVNYKEFGTQLKFTPQILDEGNIRLKVMTEVSELDFSSTVSAGGTSVPLITKRQHETIAEMRDNESLVIGGMITQKINKIHKKVPFFGDLPAVKVLFNADEFIRTDVELLVVITPHIIRPVNLNEKKVFYDEKSIKEAVKIYAPAYQDMQADVIVDMISQTEGVRGVSADEVIAFTKTVAKKMESKKNKGAGIPARPKNYMVSPPIKSP